MKKLTRVERLNKAIDECTQKIVDCNYCPYQKTADCHIAILKDLRILMVALELREVDD